MSEPSVAASYKRPLPSCLVPFASDEGRTLFQEAMAAGTMAGYFALAEQFHTQADPAFCGLGTLVVVLNALAIDPGPHRPWKGSWHWFAEEHLDCCRPLPEIQRSGVTIAQLACLARCNGARVGVQNAEATTVEMFRQSVHETATTSGAMHGRHSVSLAVTTSPASRQDTEHDGYVTEGRHYQLQPHAPT